MKAAVLKNHARLIRGVTFKPADKCDIQDKDAVACMRTKNVQTELDDSDLIAIPRAKIKNAVQLLKEGDVLVSSANSWNLLGKCCRVPKLPYSSAAGGFISILRVTSEALDSTYLYRWFASPKIQLIVRSFGNQTTNISNLSHSRVLDLSIPLPPLDEQKRIAAILDAADTLRAKRRESLSQLDALVQSTFLDMFGDPVENSMGWEQKPLTKAFHLQNGRAFKSSEWSDRGLPIIRIQNVKDHNASFNRFDGSYDDRIVVEKGDVLLCWAGQLVSICVSRWDRTVGLLNQHIFKVTPRFDAELSFASYMLHFVVEQAKTRFRGIEMKHLTKADLSREQVTIPPIELQRRFAKIVETIERQKASLQAHLDELDDLFACLQQRAFAGEL